MTKADHKITPPHTLPERQGWIDGLRLMAGLSMLGLHASANAHGLPFPDASAADRFWPMMIRALLYSARTELFLLISIFLLMLSLNHRPRSYATTMQEQASRLLPPFIFWTIFYAGYSLIKAHHFGYLPHALNSLTSLQSWVSYSVLGSVKYHMHFIPTLFALLLFYPLFRPALTRPWLGFIIIAALMGKWLLDRWAYSTYWDHAVLPYLIRLIKVISYIGYGLAAAALAGIWIRHGRALSQRVTLGLLLTLTALSGTLLAVKFTTMHIVIESGDWAFHYMPGFWADFLMPPVLMMFCMALASRSWPSILSRWAPYSFGIYLCHPIFLDIGEIVLSEFPDLRPATEITLKLTLALPMTLFFVRWLARSTSLAWTIGLGRRPYIFHRPLDLRQS